MQQMNEKRQIYSKIRMCEFERAQIWGCPKSSVAEIKGAKLKGARILMGIRYWLSG